MEPLALWELLPGLIVISRTNPTKQTRSLRTYSFFYRLLHIKTAFTNGRVITGQSTGTKVVEIFFHNLIIFKGAS